jgi:plastocyanin
VPQSRWPAVRNDAQDIFAIGAFSTIAVPKGREILINKSDVGSREIMHNKRVRTWTLITLFLLFGWFGFGELVSRGAPAPGSPAQVANAAGTGEITGEVQFQGTRPHPQTLNMAEDPECIQENQGREVYIQDGAVNSNSTLPNAFVYVKSGAQGQFTPPAQDVALDQQGCIYVPHVLGIMVGQTLEVINSDFTTHNIHVMPKNNPEWNTSQPPGAAPLYKKFDHPEIMIPIKCNEHPWMKSYIGVVTNPFYAVTDTQGRFTIKGLPAGTYTIETWTATFGTQEKTVTVRSNEAATLDFTLKGQ